MRHYIVMGVSGSGKSTVAEALAKATDGTLIDADDLHPASNVDKMRAGIALTDADRWPWLAAVAGEMRATPGTVFCACSALKRSYRKHLGEKLGEPVMFVHLQGSRPLIAKRMSGRKGHFMPASLLENQFATLEVPGSDEPAVNVDISRSKSDVVATILRAIGESR